MIYIVFHESPICSVLYYNTMKNYDTTMLNSGVFVKSTI